MTDSALRIDGSQGEGGGQIIRSSLALSLVTGRPFAIDNIRANRPRPGLRRQHLAAVIAAAQVGQADMRGAELGSRRLIFEPRGVKPGRLTFSVGTAGSATLVLQTVLPALILAREKSKLTIEGGTHNPMAPPFDFVARTFLPLVNRLGPTVATELVRPGFFPAGGGKFIAHIEPTAKWARFELLARQPLKSRRARAMVANLPRHIGERECQTIVKAKGWHTTECSVEQIDDSAGPGNVVLIELDFENVCEVVTGFGKQGVPAERVARGAVREANRFIESGVPVGPHLADQLMLLLAIGHHVGSGGGTFRTSELTKHSTTQLEVIREFLQIAGQVVHDEDGSVLVRFE